MCKDELVLKLRDLVREINSIISKNGIGSLVAYEPETNKIIYYDKSDGMRKPFEDIDMSYMSDIRSIEQQMISLVRDFYQIGNVYSRAYYGDYYFFDATTSKCLLGVDWKGEITETRVYS